MTDVFIGYSPKDRAAAARLAEALEARGVKVSWDREALGSEANSDAILRQLDAARVAMVIWSPESVGLASLRDEAERAAVARKLLSVLDRGFEAKSIPPSFAAFEVRSIDDGEGLFRALEAHGVALTEPPRPTTELPADQKDNMAEAKPAARLVGSSFWKWSAGLALLALLMTGAFSGKIREGAQQRQQQEARQRVEENQRKAQSCVALTAPLRNKFSDFTLVSDTKLLGKSQDHFVYPSQTSDEQDLQDCALQCRNRSWCRAFDPRSGRCDMYAQVKTESDAQCRYWFRRNP